MGLVARLDNAPKQVSPPDPGESRPGRDAERVIPTGAGGRVGDARAMARMLAKLPVEAGEAALQTRRRLVAEWFHVLGASYRESTSPAAVVELSPRQRQTLQRLLMGDSEKQIARTLSLSPHTVHVHVKEIYRRHGVSSRGELLALFVRRPMGDAPASRAPASKEANEAARAASLAE